MIISIVIGGGRLTIINMQKSRQPLQRILRSALRSKPDDAARPGHNITTHSDELPSARAEPEVTSELSPPLTPETCGVWALGARLNLYLNAQAHALIKYSS